MADVDARRRRGNVATGPVTVRLTNVWFSYPGSPTPALCDVSAQFSKGEVAVITGRLGAGCSTLLQVISGLAPGVVGGELTGDVLTLGIDPTTETGRHELAGRVGLLLSTPGSQLSGMSFTVAEEVAFGPANLGWERGRIAAAVERTLTMFEVQHLANRDPQTLSGGELQRVMLAAVIAMEPEVLLLDDPLQGLDPEVVDSVIALLPRLARDAAVIVAATDIDEVIEVAASVHVLDNGAVLASGAPAKALRNDTVIEKKLSTTVAELARSAGIGPPYPISIADLRNSLEP